MLVWNDDETVLVDVLCNRCGESCRDSMGMNFEAAEVTCGWGYCSDKDGQGHSGHLCEKCYDAMVKEWKLPPFIYDCLHGPLPKRPTHWGCTKEVK